MESDTSAAERLTRRGLMLVLATGVVAYLGWRLATVIGAPSVAAVALWLVELAAWIGVAAFLARVGIPHRFAPVGPRARLPTTMVVAVLASDRTAAALEHTLASLDTGDCAPAVLVVDAAVRPEISAVAASSGATVLAAADSGTVAAVNALTAVVPEDAAVVLVEAGSLLAAGALDALVAPMNDATVGAVQGALDWADPATITVHGPSRDGLGVLVGREAPAAGLAGVAPILDDGFAVRARALSAIDARTTDLTVAFATAGWLVRFVATPVAYRPRPASATQWRAIRSAQISGACRSARAAVRAGRVPFSTRARIVAGAGDVASAYARIGLVALVVTALVSGAVPVPGPLGATIFAAAVLWAFATAAVDARMAPVLRVGDRLRLGWHRLDADLLAPFTRSARAGHARHAGNVGGPERRRRIRALSSFPICVVALVAVDVAAFVRGLALIRPSIVPEIPTPLERATIGVVTLGVLLLLVDSLRIFVARPDGRIDLRVPARVAAIVGAQRAELRDLSPTGAGLLCGEAIPPGTAIQLRFSLSSSEELAIDGHVARVDHIATASGSSSYRVGVRFDGMSPETHHALVHYVATTAPGAAAAAVAGALPRSSSVPVPRPVLQFASVMAVIVATISLIAAPAGAAPPTPTPMTRFVGTVADASGPFAGACVSAVDVNWQWWTVVTDSTGGYTLDAPAGSYRFQIRDCNRVSDPTAPRLAGGWWSPTGLQTQSDAQTVAGADGATSTPIDVTLPVGGWFTGVLQDPASTPVDGICVTPVSVTGDWDGGTTTPSNGGAAGTFETAVLIPGRYRLAVNDCGSSRPEVYARGWVTGDGTAVTPFEPEARVYDVAATGLDVGTVTLEYGTRISGTVLTDDGTPAANICVAVNGENWSWVGGGNTAPDGTYTTDVVPAGDWVLSFSDCNISRTLVSAFWNGTPTGTHRYDDATRVRTEGASARLDGYDLTLVRGGQISGVVTGTSGPVADVCVNALRLTGTNDWDWLTGTRSASDGAYDLGPIAPGDVAIHANSCNDGTAVLEGLYAGPGVPLTRHQEDATTFTVVAGDAPVTGIDITVELGAILSGTLSANGTPLADGCVSALDPSTGAVGGSSTDSNGSWRTVVPRGDYLVQGTSCRSAQALAGRFLDDATDPAVARVVAAGPGDVIPGLDIDLPSANPGGIRGRVTTRTGVAPQACVVVVAPESEPVAVAPNASDGTFDLSGINPGSYLVGFAGCDFGDDGLPPGVVDPTDPSVVYQLQWSSGRSIEQDTLWMDPAWVTVTADTTTDIGTICLQPCDDPTVEALPGPTAPVTPPPPTTAVPGGFTAEPAPAAGTPTPESASTLPTDTLAARAIAPPPPAATTDAPDAGTTADATANRTLDGRTQSATARRTGAGDTGNDSSGVTSWWWAFALAATVAAIAVGVPWHRSRAAA